MIPWFYVSQRKMALKQCSHFSLPLSEELTANSCPSEVKVILQSGNELRVLQCILVITNKEWIKDLLDPEPRETESSDRIQGETKSGGVLLISWYCSSFLWLSLNKCPNYPHLVSLLRAPIQSQRPARAHSSPFCFCWSCRCSLVMDGLLTHSRSSPLPWQSPATLWGEWPKCWSVWPITVQWNAANALALCHSGRDKPLTPYKAKHFMGYIFCMKNSENSTKFRTKLH